MFDQARTDSLIASIFRTATEPGTWEAVLRDIALALGGIACQIVAFDKRTGAVMFSHLGGTMSPQVHLDYLRHYHRIDPRTPLLITSSTQGWMQCHHHIDQQTVDTHPFYQDFLLPHGGRYVSGCKLVDDADLVAVLGVHRGPQGGPLVDEELRWLDRLRGFMTQALQTTRALGQLRLERAAGLTIIDSMPVPTALIGIDRRVLMANAPFQLWVARHPDLSWQGERLRVSDRRVEGAIDTAVAELLLHPAPLEPAPHRVLRLPAVEPGQEARASLRPLRPEATMGAFGAGPCVLFSVHDPDVDRTPSTALLCDLFDLTPAEAEVAIGLSQGLDPQAIATRRGVSVVTVRSQVATAASKLGLSRATDLALAVTRAAWLGP